MRGRRVRFRDNNTRLECTRNRETVIIEAGERNTVSPHNRGHRNSINLPRKLDLRAGLARSCGLRAENPCTRCIIPRCRATMRGIKLEIGESSYRKSANRLAAVRFLESGRGNCDSGSRGAFPFVPPTKKPLLLLCECTCVLRLCGFTCTHVRTHVRTVASCSLGR